MRQEVVGFGMALVSAGPYANNLRVAPDDHTNTHTHTRLTALCPGLPGWAGTRKVKPIWILLKQETVSGSEIGWAICKSAPCSRQITTPAPHHSVFYRPVALPVTQPTASKHWRHNHTNTSSQNIYRPDALPDAQPTVSKHWMKAEQNY